MIARLLFAVLTGLGLVLCITVFIPEVPNSHGLDHPEIGDMKQGGPGAERHARIGWPAWAFGSLQIVFFVTCLALGLKDLQRSGKWLIVGGLIYLAVFTWMVVADRHYALSSSSSLYWSFPAPTAVMLFGLCTTPLFFVILYIVKFDRWILRPADLKAFRDSLASAQEDKADG